MTAKVWVVQEGPHDYTPAIKYGDVEFITGLEYSPFENSKANMLVDNDIEKFVSSYIPGKDYIVCAGSPITIARLFMTLGNDHPDALHNILKWDARSAVYVEYKVSSL